MNSTYTLAQVQLDLDVFQGPFDLLLNLILNEEIDLLEVDLADVVLAYIEHLERVGEIDLEVTTEFLVLIASLLELKSRLMLPQDGSGDELGLEPVEAAEELLARMLEYSRIKSTAEWMRERFLQESGYLFRDAPLPLELRRISVEAATKAYEPEQLGRALGELLREPPQIDLSHIRTAFVSLEQRLSHLRGLLASKGTFTFDDAVEDADRVTEAVTLFALLEMYKKGELSWKQDQAFGTIEISPGKGTEG